MNELMVIFAQGFIFLGKPQEPSHDGVCAGLKDAVKLDMIYVPTAQGLAPVTTMRMLGFLAIDPSSFPHFYLNDKSIYADYVKLTTGIEIPKNGKTH